MKTGWKIGLGLFVMSSALMVTLSGEAAYNPIFLVEDLLGETGVKEGNYKLLSEAFEPRISDAYSYLVLVPVGSTDTSGPYEMLVYYTDGSHDYFQNPNIHRDLIRGTKRIRSIVKGCNGSVAYTSCGKHPFYVSLKPDVPISRISVTVDLGSMAHLNVRIYGVRGPVLTPQSLGLIPKVTLDESKQALDLASEGKQDNFAKIEIFTKLRASEISEVALIYADESYDVLPGPDETQSKLPIVILPKSQDSDRGPALPHSIRLLVPHPEKVLNRIIVRAKVSAGNRVNPRAHSILVFRGYKVTDQVSPERDPQ